MMMVSLDDVGSGQGEPTEDDYNCKDVGGGHGGGSPSASPSRRIEQSSLEQLRAFRPLSPYRSPGAAMPRQDDDKEVTPILFLVIINMIPLLRQPLVPCKYLLAWVCLGRRIRWGRPWCKH